MTPRSRTRSVAPIALALCVTLLAACGSSAAPAATLGGVDVTDAQLAHEEDVFGFLAGLNQQPCGTAEGDETEEAACARFALTNLIQEHFVNGLRDENDIDVTDAAGREDGRAARRQPREGRGRCTAEGARSHARRPVGPRAPDPAVRRGADGDRRRRHVARPISATSTRTSLTSYVTVQVDHILVETKAEADDVYAQVTAPGCHRAGLPGPREGGLDRPDRHGRTPAAWAPPWPPRTSPSSPRPRSRWSRARSPSP